MKSITNKSAGNADRGLGPFKYWWVALFVSVISVVALFFTIKPASAVGFLSVSPSTVDGKTPISVQLYEWPAGEVVVTLCSVAKPTECAPQQKGTVAKGEHLFLDYQTTGAKDCPCRLEVKQVNGQEVKSIELDKASDEQAGSAQGSSGGSSSSSKLIIAGIVLVVLLIALAIGVVSRKRTPERGAHRAQPGDRK